MNLGEKLQQIPLIPVDLGLYLLDVQTPQVGDHLADHRFSDLLVPIARINREGVDDRHRFRLAELAVENLAHQKPHGMLVDLGDERNLHAGLLEGRVDFQAEVLPARAARGVLLDLENGFPGAVISSE